VALDPEHTIPSGSGTRPPRDRRNDGGELQNLLRVTWRAGFQWNRAPRWLAPT
jgi:hypothetical protein